MLTAKSMDRRDNFKDWCDKISMRETVIISRPHNENIYMINEAEYNALKKAKQNASYMAKVHESVENHKEGGTISLTLYLFFIRYLLYFDSKSLIDSRRNIFTKVVLLYLIFFKFINYWQSLQI